MVIFYAETVVESGPDERCCGSRYPYTGRWRSVTASAAGRSCNHRSNAAATRSRRTDSSARCAHADAHVRPAAGPKPLAGVAATGTACLHPQTRRWKPARRRRQSPWWTSERRGGREPAVLEIDDAHVVIQPVGSGDHARVASRWARTGERRWELARAAAARARWPSSHGSGRAISPEISPSKGTHVKQPGGPDPGGRRCGRRTPRRSSQDTIGSMSPRARSAAHAEPRGPRGSPGGRKERSRRAGPNGLDLRPPRSPHELPAARPRSARRALRRANRIVDEPTSALDVTVRADPPVIDDVAADATALVFSPTTCDSAGLADRVVGIYIAGSRGRASDVLRQPTHRTPGRCGQRPPHRRDGRIRRRDR